MTENQMVAIARPLNVRPGAGGDRGIRIRTGKGQDPMRKLFVLSWLVMMIAWGIGGCGGGGTSADPLGTDSLAFGQKTGTDLSMEVQVNPRGTVVLTAKIKNAGGKEVAGREVAFGFKANQSGAALNASAVNTDAAGEAVVYYTAGAANGIDVIHASISNGAGSDTIITVSGSSPPVTTGSIALFLTKPSDGSTTASVSVDSPSILTAILKDSAGLPVAGTVVSFSTVSDLSFNPASGAVLTAADGKASITVNAGNTTGVTTIRAAATDPSGNAVSGNINLSVTAPNLSLSALTITPATLSAGGSAGVSITVNDGSGNPFTASVPVSFTSLGAQANKAAITSQVFTVNGVALATYRDINYAAVDTITAALSIGGTTFTKTGTITVHAASAGSILFISATPAHIALKGTGGMGRSETSVVVFKVLDTNGNPIMKRVNFSLNTTVGGLSLTAAGSDSDPVSGLVQTIVQAGTVSTPVRVSATIDGTAISTTSDQLVISTGIPDQDSFSIGASMLNIEGWNVDGATSDIGVRLADHFNNPVPDGTAVYFRSSGGSIQPSCTTTNGACKVTFTSQAPRPANGRVRILAYALGEESFVDLNGNGIYDAGETYADMPEPFLDATDATENGTRDVPEEFVDTNADGLYSPGDGVFNGILRDASVSGPTTIHVRNSGTVVLSGSDAVITVTTIANTITPCTTAAPFTPGSVLFHVVVKDVNGQVMPAGTTILFSTTNGTIMTTPATYAVPNTSTKSPPTYPVTIQSDAVQAGDGTATPYTCTNTKPSGIFTVTVTTPKGVSSYQYTTVND